MNVYSRWLFLEKNRSREKGKKERRKKEEEISLNIGTAGQKIGVILSAIYQNFFYTSSMHTSRRLVSDKDGTESHSRQQWNSLTDIIEDQSSIHIKERGLSFNSDRMNFSPLRVPSRKLGHRRGVVMDFLLIRVCWFNQEKGRLLMISRIQARDEHLSSESIILLSASVLKFTLAADIFLSSMPLDSLGIGSLSYF